jgi:predicted nucleic acid-binding protein
VANFSALLDACVIFPYSLSDTLLRAAEIGLYQMYFSEQILQEATRNRIDRGRMTASSAEKFQRILRLAFPESLVEFPVDLERMMTNHPKDRHVLAAAVHATANLIVTMNLKDFPDSALSHWKINAIHPDDFLVLLCDQYGDDTLYILITEQAASYRKSLDRTQPDKQPPVTTSELLTALAKALGSSHSKFVTRMQNYCEDG